MEFTQSEIIQVIFALENQRKILLNEYKNLLDEDDKERANQVLLANRSALEKAKTIEYRYTKELES